MKALLFAAGLGTRLKPFTDHHPKALARVHGKTLLEHSIRYLQRHDIRDVIVNVHHFADQIEAELQEHDGFGSRVAISDERDAVLETGGGLKRAGWFFEGQSDFVTLNVDALTNLDLSKMVAAHRASGAAATLAVMRRTSSRYLLMDADMRLCGWRNEKTGECKLPRPAGGLRDFAFSGIQVVSQAFLQGLRMEGKFSLVDAYLDLAPRLELRGYDHTGDLFIDVGKPESLEQAGKLFS
jgi:NDP-sugar pyrophosphorylase family protein